MSVETLARPEIRDLRAYETAVQANGAIRLHANESSWSWDEDNNSVNRYPELRPIELQARLAARFAVPKEQLLVTRGSSEAIDLLIRAFCRAREDNIVISPPTFPMYRVFADIQGAGVINCPLMPENDFDIDIESLLDSCTPNSKLIFVCSPNNPTGNLPAQADIVRLLEERKEQSMIVLDEAYIEFSGTESAAKLIADYDNVVVLRTLSKALALAGARCGAVIGRPALINMLNAVQPPYAMATPVVDCVISALSSDDSNASQVRIEETIRERRRVAELLETNKRVARLWPSYANFLFVQFRDLSKIKERLQAKRILIREIGGNPDFENFARITIGSVDENDRLLAALSEQR